MKRFSMLVVPLMLALLLVACGDDDGDGDGTSTPTPTATATPSATEGTPAASPTAGATGTPAATETPSGDQAICLQAGEYLSDGSYTLDLPAQAESYAITELRWSAHEGCERFVIDLALAGGGDAGVPVLAGATWHRDLGVLTIAFADVATVDQGATELSVDGALLDSAFVVRAPDQESVFVRLHLAEAAEAAITVLEGPSRVVVDLRPGGAPVPPPAAAEAGVVILTPRGGDASYPLTVSGYARSFEANVVVRLVQDGEIVHEEPTTASDWTQMWGWFELTIPSGPSGTVELQAGDYSPANGQWEGASVELELP